MSHEILKETRRETGHGTDLWRVISAPLVWVAHFLICYILVAIRCEKLGRDAGLTAIAPQILAVTLAALLLILWTGVKVWKVWAVSQTENDFDFDHNTPEERHRFLSHAALMLAGLSAVAVCFTAWPILWLEVCR